MEPREQIQRPACHGRVVRKVVRNLSCHLENLSAERSRRCWEQFSHTRTCARVTTCRDALLPLWGKGGGVDIRALRVRRLGQSARDPRCYNVAVRCSIQGWGSVLRYAMTSARSCALLKATGTLAPGSVLLGAARNASSVCSFQTVSQTQSSRVQIDTQRRPTCAAVPVPIREVQ